METDTASVITGLGMFSSSDHTSVIVSLNLFVALLCTCIVVGHYLEENRWMNESITALAIVSPWLRLGIFWENVCYAEMLSFDSSIIDFDCRAFALG